MRTEAVHDAKPFLQQDGVCLDKLTLNVRAEVLSVAAGFTTDLTIAIERHATPLTTPEFACAGVNRMYTATLTCYEGRYSYCRTRNCC